MHQPAREEEKNEGHRQAEAGRGAPIEIEWEKAKERVDGDAGEAVGAAGPLRAIGNLEKDRGDPDGDHQPRQIRSAEDEEARRESDQSRRDGAGSKAEERIGGNVE